MSNQEYNYVENEIITENECKAFKPIITDFMHTYAQNVNTPIEEWLGAKMHSYLPEKSKEEISAMTNEIIATVRINDEKKKSLSESIKKGRSKESWFASEVKKITSKMSAQEAEKYLHELDAAVDTANEAMYKTIMKKSGDVSMNPRLDGYIAEQYHVNSFNMDAAVKDSSLRARVLTPKPGQPYTKNGFDAVIENSANKRVHQYQSKYGSDSKHTNALINRGNYNNQQLLVPTEQVADVQKFHPNKTVTDVIKEGNVSSKPLTKENAKVLQKRAQNGKSLNVTWNDYNVKDLAQGIGKKAGHAAVQSALISTGFDIAQKLWKGEEVKGEDVIETALTNGADAGVKCAAAGALTVAVRKNIIKSIPVKTSLGTLTNIAHVAIENIKILGKVAKRELTFREGIERMEQTTVSTVSGILAMAKGTAIGGKIGTVIGAAIGGVFAPAGTAVGSFIGGTVAYISGSKIGEAVTKCAQSIRNKAVEFVSKAAEGVKNVGTSIANGVKNFCSGIKKIFS